MPHRLASFRKAIRENWRAASPHRTVGLVCAVAAVWIAGMWLASVAFAQAGTVALSVAPLGYPAPGGAQFEITAAGTYAETDSDVEEIDVYVHEGPNGCPATDAAENSQVESQGLPAEELTDAEVGTGTEPMGSYTESGAWGLDALKGTYWACAYLLGSADPTQPPLAAAKAQISEPGPSSQPIPTSGPSGGGSGGGKSACVVPRIVGRKLAAARRALVAAHCMAGKITRRKGNRTNRGRVISQSLPPGRRRPPGARVNVVVGR
jgi:hypothetical protein